MTKKIFFFFLFSFLICLNVDAEASKYQTIENDVYYDGILLDFVDAATFVELGNDFAQDKNFCVFENQKISSCRVKSFEVLEGKYARDDYYVFYGKDKVEGAEAKTFAYIGEGYARDRSQVFYKGKLSAGIKSDSFVLLGSGYAKDSSSLYFDNQVVSGIDPGTVSVISENYIKDAVNVYFNGEIILDADPDTFEEMSEGYAWDKSYYFLNGKAVAKITNRKYERYKKRDQGEGIDEETFEVIDDLLARDKNYVYYLKDDEYVRIPFSHADSFKKLEAGYYKDNYAVYYGEDFNEVNGAQAESFKVTCTLDSCQYEAQDDERFFLEGNEVGVDEITKQMIGEAKMIYESYQNLNALLAYNALARNLNSEIEMRSKFLDKLTTRVYGLQDDDKQAVLNFVTYGTQTTRALGAGERAGVVNSYKTAFGKLPTSAQEWTDVVKIANGRWPTERNEVAEEPAERRFRYIYHRTPLSMDAHDNAAITIMAYGLRTAKRNQANEKAAILTFRGMFLEYPVSSSDWDMVRAIAYSGAGR